MRPSRRRLAVLLSCLATLAAAGTARAVERFPGAIRDQLGLDYEPPCRVCHIQGTTGSGSVQTPFGISMLARGMTQSESTLAPALAKLRADGTDSDGDGKGDVAELMANTDPNTPVDVPLVGTDPQYGCGVAGGAPAGALGGLTLGLGAVLAARRRRRGPAEVTT